MSDTLHGDIPTADTARPDIPSSVSYIKGLEKDRLPMTRSAAVAIALCTLLAACNQAPPQNANANTPGYTGSTVIPGNNSTIAGNAEATYLQQKWGGMSPRR